ncbi:uncharacterized protein [Montipora foliosa]|uniref:uncharacterized protein n=1 Tax=Montipora foliosa TaxID=591990 RepID=UPI0035F13371
MRLVKLLTMVLYMAGSVKRSLSDDFGSCNYTEFVADTVGDCENRFYMSLALDHKADCHLSYSRLEDCFARKTRNCLKGHLSADKLEYFINITLLVQRSLGSSQFYCSKTSLNISALDPKLRELIPCTNDLFTEGLNCTRRFREIFHLDRNDSSLCEAFFRARRCTQSSLNRHCANTAHVPIDNRFNPFCHHRKEKPAIVQFPSSKKSTNDTKTISLQPTLHSRAHRSSKILSRMLSVAVGVVNLKTAVKNLGLN